MGLDRVIELSQRVGMSPSEAVAMACLALASLTLTVVVWSGGGGLGPFDPVNPATGASEGTSATSSPDEGMVITAPDEPTELTTVVVDVAGFVVRPGLVELPSGSRVAEAVAAAGGPTAQADTANLNLARVLVDGEQILVGDGTMPVQTAPEASTGPALLADGRLSLNAATLTDLQTLPGVGPVTAERILAHRDQMGGFTDLIQLLEVPGIGPARFADLETRVGL